MSPAIPTPTASSTVTSSSATSCPPQDFHVLEISFISAQDLQQVSKSMRTYAVAWIHPNRKRCTRVDQQGYNNPTWNDRFTFRVDDELLFSDHASVTVEMYTVSWFKDVLVGTVCVLMSDLITPYAMNSTRFVALQIHRPSGNPQGKLNMGVALMDGTKRSMPICRGITASGTDHQDTLQNKVDQMSLQGKVGEIYDEQQVNSKIQLWRSYSAGTSDVNEQFPAKAGSVCNGSMVDGSICNGSMVNGSELCSDVGPSASIVAAEIAQKSQYHPSIPNRSTNILRTKELIDDNGNSVGEDLTVEEARAKGLTSNIARWKKEVSVEHEQDDGNFEMKAHESTRRHSRRNSDEGLFSCFGNAYGFEFTIVCGSCSCGNIPKDSKFQRKRPTSSEANSA